MPCLIITGHPCSGKTTLAKKLREVALEHYSPSVIDDVILINEESEFLLHDDDGGNGSDNGSGNGRHNNHDGYTKESWYINQLAEKQTRGTLKAAFDRVVGRKESSTATATAPSTAITPSNRPSPPSSSSKRKRRTLVILDSMNYIKGFRYELHCISKAAGEQHGVLWVLNRRQYVEEWNKDANHYSPGLLKELISRFEPPDDRNRWDKPLFTVDVAPSTSSSNNNNSNNTNIKAASAALKDSVYNMYTLSDVLPGDEQSNSPSGNDGTTETESKATSSSKSRTVKKSAFSRAPKKSAFTRKSNVVAATSSKPQPQSSSLQQQQQQQQQQLIDGIPLDLSEANHGQEEMVIDETSNLRSSTDKIAATKSVAYSQQPDTDSSTATSRPAKSMDDHLRNILDVFLLRTEALKEGTSTQTMAAGQANVLADLDSITARTMTSIINATQPHQPPCDVQVDVPIVGTMKTSQNTTTVTMKYPRHVGLAEIRQTRKKFLQWSASHPPDDSSEYAIAKSFIKFVEDSL